MRTIYENVEELNQLLEGFAACSAMLPEEMEQWESIIMDYNVCESLNREED